jgi:hypothetical protein
MFRQVSSLVPLAGALAFASVARADDGMTKATAEALFVDGKRLITIGNYASACPKFAASQKLDPGIGTALNLADCYERLGRIASAWAEFRGAASAAHAAGSKDREQLAADRAKALESQLSYLTITSSNADALAVQISRDGSVVDPAVLGTPIPVDPGQHNIEAAAPGRRKWSVAIDVGATATRITVNVPSLGDGVAPVGSAQGTAPSPANPATYGGAQRGVGIGLGVLGVMGLAAGTVFGLKARSSWDDAKKQCANPPNACTPAGVTLAEDARAAGNAATVAFVIGAAALAGGAIVFFTAPKNTNGERKLSLQVLPSSVTLVGQF